jgi:lysozyme
MPDISHWQGPHTVEDMQLVAAKAPAIMLKASEGTSTVDAEFVNNAEAATAAGLTWGAYHYVTAGHGKAQADHFAETVDSVSGECRFYCIDWEAGSRDTALALADRLLMVAITRLETPVGDYIGSHARANGGQLPDMDFHMVPQYGPAEINPDYATDPLSAWQYTNGTINGTGWPSSVPGIGACDVSVIYRPQDFGLIPPAG